MICSSEPDGMMRASTASARSRSAARLRSPGRRPIEATSPSYGTIAPVCPRASSARVSSRVCQPSRAARMTRCRLLLLADEGREPAGGELGKIIAYLLEGRGRDALLELLHRVEAQ